MHLKRKRIPDQGDVVLLDFLGRASSNDDQLWFFRQPSIMPNDQT